MVSGIYRIGGIAALIVDAGRYLLATYFQENLKYVRPGQPVEVAFDLYPGQIFRGRVDTIWKANGAGQYLPSDEIPKFHPLRPDIPQGQYAVKILLNDSDASKFPIGAQASAAIYTNGETGAWAALRKIRSGRAHGSTGSIRCRYEANVEGKLPSDRLATRRRGEETDLSANPNRSATMAMPAPRAGGPSAPSHSRLGHPPH